MVDYREDIRIGKEILARTVEAYRKIRNVIRVLVANLYDFDPGSTSRCRWRTDAGDRPLGCWRSTPSARTRIVKAYDDYDYPAIFQAANTFITVDLSAFYVDVTKDRMYTFGADVRSAAIGPDGDVRGRRRPGAAAGADPVGDDGRAVARRCPGTRVASVHMALFPMGDEIAGDRNPDLLASVGRAWPRCATR